MTAMKYDPDEIMREIEERAEWIEFRASSRKNKSTSLDEYRAMSYEKRKLEHECALAVEKCLSKRYGRA